MFNQNLNENLHIANHKNDQLNRNYTASKQNLQEENESYTTKFLDILKLSVKFW